MGGKKNVRKQEKAEARDKEMTSDIFAGVVRFHKNLSLRLVLDYGIAPSRIPFEDMHRMYAEGISAVVGAAYLAEKYPKLQAGSNGNSQDMQILYYLQEHGSITDDEAREFCGAAKRLAASIHKLRSNLKGSLTIVSERIKEVNAAGKAVRKTRYHLCRNGKKVVGK